MATVVTNVDLGFGEFECVEDSWAEDSEGVGERIRKWAKASAEHHVLTRAIQNEMDLLETAQETVVSYFFSFVLRPDKSPEFRARYQALKDALREAQPADLPEGLVVDKHPVPSLVVTVGGVRSVVAHWQGSTLAVCGPASDACAITLGDVDG